MQGNENTAIKGNGQISSDGLCPLGGLLVLTLDFGKFQEFSALFFRISLIFRDSSYSKIHLNKLESPDLYEEDLRLFLSLSCLVDLVVCFVWLACLSSCLFVCRSACPFVCRFVCLSAFLFVGLLVSSVYLSVFVGLIACSFVCLSICLSVCWSVGLMVCIG